MDDSDFCLFESEIEELYHEKEKPTITLTLEEAKELQRGFSEGTISTIYLWIDKNAFKFSRLLEERISRVEGK